MVPWGWHYVEFFLGDVLELFSGVVLWVRMEVWLSMDSGGGKDGGEIESDTTL
jgi:hypothetical protein